ncbi:SIR2 family protein [Azotobacter chroococcum]|uniref:SIR2 family protein n=1 Tax=Azotobacter chroococcum TaxID=353 RepID=UPI000B78FCC2|nr:SIR2 family protein [Azotobacter chroococcum]
MDNLPNTFDPTSSILFLGSGFSVEAKNSKGDPLPVGQGLSDLFGKELGLSEDEIKQYDLPTLAKEMADLNEGGAWSILYDTFSVTELSETQTNILSQDWRRIYTTNYDNSVEFHYASKGIRGISYSWRDGLPKKIKHGSVIHLHGSISNVSNMGADVFDEFILDFDSYAKQHFIESAWYEEFCRDVRFASAVFFLGYSLSDYLIASLLSKDDAWKGKIYFLKRKKDPIFERKADGYGKIVYADLEAFSLYCNTAPRPEKGSNLSRLKAFREINPFKDGKKLPAPTLMETHNLIVFGQFDDRRCFAARDKSSRRYIVPRSESIAEALDTLNRVTTLLIHSHTGNGKSIFLHILSHELIAQGKKCFWCVDLSAAALDEITVIRDSGITEPIFIFDNYNTAIDLIPLITGMIGGAKFISAIRSGVWEVRLHEINDKLPSPIDYVSLNGFRGEEKQQLTLLLDDAGLLGDTERKELRNCESFRDVVSMIYKNTKVMDSIRSRISPILDTPHRKNILGAFGLFKWLGSDIGNAYLKSVFNRDVSIEFAVCKSRALEVFRFSEGDAEIYSSTFSGFLLASFFESEELLEIVRKCLLFSVKLKKENRKHNSIVAELMQISNLTRLCRVAGDEQHNAILSLFDELHRDSFINREPLFWLQYSILMLSMNDYLQARTYIETAYDRVEYGFKTYQIDTHALRVYLSVASRKPTEANHEKILQHLDVVVEMLSDNSHRRHALRAIFDLGDFITRYTCSDGELWRDIYRHLIKARDALVQDGLGNTEQDIAKLSNLVAAAMKKAVC